jgi:hypothetical protein
LAALMVTDNPWSFIPETAPTKPPQVTVRTYVPAGLKCNDLVFGKFISHIKIKIAANDHRAVG